MLWRISSRIILWIETTRGNQRIIPKQLVVPSIVFNNLLTPPVLMISPNSTECSEEYPILSTNSIHYVTDNPQQYQTPSTN